MEPLPNTKNVNRLRNLDSEDCPILHIMLQMYEYDEEFRADHSFEDFLVDLIECLAEANADMTRESIADRQKTVSDSWSKEPFTTWGA